MLLSGSAITVVGGKGGVGKTTVAAALAIEAADAGVSTLLVSTDPAHSLGDVLDVSLGDDPVEVLPGLWSLEPDADRTVRARLRQVEADAADALPREILPAVRRHLELAVAAPGSRESALADRLVGVLVEPDGRWDRIVVDSAPTGHLLQLLRAPSAVADWVASLAARRQRASLLASDLLAEAVDHGRDDGEVEDPLLERLRARHARTSAAADRLRDEAEVRLVCTPRRVVVAETERAAAAIGDVGLRLGTLVLNHPGGLPDDDVVGRLRRRFPAIVAAPTAPTEPIGPDALRTWWAQARRRP